MVWPCTVLRTPPSRISYLHELSKAFCGSGVEGGVPAGAGKVTVKAMGLSLTGGPPRNGGLHHRVL